MSAGLPQWLGPPRGQFLAGESAEGVERQAIRDALPQTRKLARGAKFLGISRATLQKRMKAYALRGSPG